MAERDELKINIIIKGDRILLGAQATDCDPKIRVAQGDLATAVALIPEFVAQCNQEWDVAPHNPKSTIPEPEPPKPTVTSRQSTKVAAASPQQRWF